MKNKGGVVKILMWIVFFPVMLILAILRKEGWSGKRKAASIAAIAIITLGVSVGGADNAAVTVSEEAPAQAVEEVQKKEKESSKAEMTQDLKPEIAVSEELDSQETGEASVEQESENASQNTPVMESEETKDSKEQGTENDQVLQVHFLDVGQALSVLVRDMQGNELLYDAGNEGDAEFIISYLQDLGIDRLEYVVNSHPHEDHIGGMDRILERFEVDQIFMSGTAYDSKAYRDVMNILDEKQIGAVHPEPGATYDLGELGIQVLGPLGSEYESTNDYSVILKIGNATQSVLLVGDSEAAAEHELVEAGVDLHADVFQVSHHGSSTSNTIQYLSKIDPDYAVISVGVDNSYGHPDATILDRLRNMGISTYETDLDGTIVMTLNGSRIFVEALEDVGAEESRSIDQVDVDEKNTVEEPEAAEPQEAMEEKERIAEVFVELEKEPSVESSLEASSETKNEEIGSAVVITELNKSAEYVIIKNISGEAVDIGSWQLISVTGPQYFDFPKGCIIEPNQTLKITSWDANGTGDFVMAEKRIWNNSESDPAQLIDAKGVEVDFFKD